MASEVSEPGTNCNFETASEANTENPAKLDTSEKQSLHLRLMLERDFKAADLKWSLFIAAAFSFRYEVCLRPFPSNFIKDGSKNMDELLNLISDVPALDLILQQVDRTDSIPHWNDIVDLLFYVIVRLKEPTLKTVPPELHDAVLANVKSKQPFSKPQFIFQVVSTGRSAGELKWQELAKQHTTFYAYHGNRLENFYSILNYGLQQHLNKSVLFNNGVYLTPEMSACQPHSHGGFGWGASCLGGHLSCVAMCEVVDTPEGINYHKNVCSEGDGYDAAERARRAGDAGGHTHYIVNNCDLIRVRYLLVYAKQPAAARLPPPVGRRNGPGGLRQWLNRHKLFSILLGYGLMLATLGFANNQPVQHYCKLLLNKLELAYKS